LALREQFLPVISAVTILEQGARATPPSASHSSDPSSPSSTSPSKSPTWPPHCWTAPG
jgi:hypothetical protein